MIRLSVPEILQPSFFVTETFCDGRNLVSGFDVRCEDSPAIWMFTICSIKNCPTLIEYIFLEWKWSRKKDGQHQTHCRLDPLRGVFGSCSVWMDCCVGRYLVKSALIEYMIYVIEYKAAAMLCCVGRYLVKGSLELSGVGARGGLLEPLLHIWDLTEFSSIYMGDWILLRPAQENTHPDKQWHPSWKQQQHQAKAERERVAAKSLNEEFIAAPHKMVIPPHPPSPQAILS